MEDISIKIRDKLIGFFGRPTYRIYSFGTGGLAWNGHPLRRFDDLVLRSKCGYAVVGVVNFLLTNAAVLATLAIF